MDPDPTSQDKPDTDPDSDPDPTSQDPEKFENRIGIQRNLKTGSGSSQKYRIQPDPDPQPWMQTILESKENGSDKKISCGHINCQHVSSQPSQLLLADHFLRSNLIAKMRMKVRWSIAEKSVWDGYQI